MFHRQILWIVATFLLRISDQRRLSACRRYVCYIEPKMLAPRTPYIFSPHHVDPDLCSHIIVYAVGLDGNKINIASWHADKGLAKLSEHLKDLKLKKPKLKTLLTVGGEKPHSALFSKMAATGTGRGEFINSLIPFVREQGFDGVDLYWIFPTLHGGGPADKVTYVDLIKDMATEFENEQLSSGRKKLMLSAWVPRTSYIVDWGYNVTEFARYVDMINIGTFVYNGLVNSPIGHSSPLDSNDGKNIKQTLRHWVDRGMPRPKINVAIPAFGLRGYTKSSSDMKLGESIMTGEAVTYNSRGQGILTYYQVCLLLKQGGSVHWDSIAQAPYHIKDNYFLSYENEQSIKEKVLFLRENNYGGVIFRSLSEDDYLGLNCGTGTYPLLRAIKKQCLTRDY
ncbi:unnamed protein product [Lymnaea stagnalis]|uniref:GH18 domain-containing protein n=1 Tax=Lymnaea stagnalis TaxID=6523 RepID=A0AAV2HU59_LYMST